MIAACLSEEKEIIAPYVFDGYTDATRFNGLGKECLKKGIYYRWVQDKEFLYSMINLLPPAPYY